MELLYLVKTNFIPENIRLQEVIESDGYKHKYQDIQENQAVVKSRSIKYLNNIKFNKSSKVHKSKLVKNVEKGNKG